MASTIESSPTRAPAAPPKCYLLALPRELRDEIWTLALSPNKQEFTDQNGNLVKRLDHPKFLYKPPPLLATSRQIRREVTEIFYRRTRFVCNLGRDHWLSWLQSLDPAACKHIKFVGFMECSRGHASYRKWPNKIDAILDGVPSSRCEESEKQREVDRACVMAEMKGMGVSSGAVKSLVCRKSLCVWVRWYAVVDMDQRTKASPEDFKEEICLTWQRNSY